MKRNSGIDRYPGPRPFDESEKDLFFGRTLEIDELCQLINVNSLFVIHAESGLGKSSLINAGLIPKLKEKGLYPILIRFKESRTKSPVEHVINQLRIQGKNIPDIADLEAQESIWHLVKLYNKAGVVPVLIFDQFEEFAYFDEDERKPFAAELSKLVGPSLPENIKRDLREITETNSSFSWYTQPELKLIFSLRSDRLNVLEELTSSIPSILRNRYQLKALTTEQATQTIVLPAVMESMGNIQFSTHSFNYTPELIGDILDVVKDNRTNNVETTHLQMICQEIEAIARVRTTNGDGIVITQQDLNGKKGLEELVRNFYYKQLEKIKADKQISPEEYRAIRILIEKRLLVQGKRIPLAEQTIYQQFRDMLRKKNPRTNLKEPEGVEVEEANTIEEEKIKYIIDLLLSLRLIRDQNYGGTVFYEIGHDTLINPILDEMRNREMDEQQREETEAARKRQIEFLKQKKQVEEVQKQKRIADEAREKAEKLQKKAEKLKARDRRRSIILVLVILGGLIFVVLQNDNIKANNSQIKGQLAKIANFEAINSYNDGNQILAYALWKTSDSLKKDTSIQYRLNHQTYAPFAGREIKVSHDHKYVVTKNAENEINVWLNNKKDNKISKAFSAEHVADYELVAGSDILWYLSDSAELKIFNLATKKQYAPIFTDSIAEGDKIGEVYSLPKAGVLQVLMEIADTTFLFDLNTGRALNVLMDFIVEYSTRYYKEYAPPDFYDYDDNRLILRFPYEILLVTKEGQVEKRWPIGDEFPVFSQSGKQFYKRVGQSLYQGDMQVGISVIKELKIEPTDKIYWTCDEKKLLIIRSNRSGIALTSWDLQQRKKTDFQLPPVRPRFRDEESLKTLYFEQGLSQEGNELIFIDTAKQVYLLNTCTGQSNHLRTVKKITVNKQKTGFIVEDKGTFYYQDFALNIPERISAAIPEGYSITNIYPGEFLECWNRKTRDYILIYIDAERNEIQKIAASYKDYITTKLDSLGIHPKSKK